MFALIKRAKKRYIPFSFGDARSWRPVPMRVRMLRYLGYTLAVPVALDVVLGLINLNDRKLDPRAADAMLPAPTTVADQANAMFAMLGPGVPDGEDPQAFGQRYVEASNQRMLASDEGKPYDFVQRFFAPGAGVISSGNTARAASSNALTRAGSAWRVSLSNSRFEPSTAPRSPRRAR